MSTLRELTIYPNLEPPQKFPKFTGYIPVLCEAAGGSQKSSFPHRSPSYVFSQLPSKGLHLASSVGQFD
jgi:hypothetical protein